MKKDIVYQNESVEKDEGPKMSVDEIFANADAQMVSMDNASSVFKKTKKKMGIIKKTIITTLILAVICIIVFVVFLIKSVDSVLPNAKEMVLSQITETRNELLEMDDSELSVDEYYQKQIFLLLDMDLVEEKVNSLTSLQTLTGMISGNGFASLDLIPEEKEDEYQKLLKEYEEAKQAEEAKLSESEETDETGNDVDADSDNEQIDEVEEPLEDQNSETQNNDN